MNKGTWHVIGVMSGTSLDGVDIAYIRFTNDDKLKYELIATTTVPYSTSWKNKLADAFFTSKSKLNKLDEAYSIFLGFLINSFIDSHNITEIDFIASHGHTIFHKPNEGYTLQIGNKAAIAKTCQRTVVCDFRTQDVALGGQGAPLVPIGDELLFSDYDYCLNIGGFSNISFDKKGIRKAYDICPANIVLNYYTRQIGLEYDDKGALAKSGDFNSSLLNSLDSLPIYLNKNSQGNEEVLQTFIPLINSFNLPVEDILRTYVEHIASKIAQALHANTSTLITGGGAYNSFLIERIKILSKSRLILPNKNLIDYKEALIFGLLGLLRIEDEINCLASVTKASKNHSSGIVFNP